MYTIERTTAALLERLTGTDAAQITVKSTGDIITVRKHDVESDNITVDLTCNGLVFRNPMPIEDAAAVINNFASYKNEQIAEICSLEQFFCEHLLGHSEQEWQLAGRVYNIIYDEWTNANSRTRLDIYALLWFERVAKELGITVPEAITAFNLEYDDERYSDRYRALYGEWPDKGYRPAVL